MAHYYLNLRTAGGLIVDDEGLELESIGALSEAVYAGARGMMAEELRTTGAIDFSPTIEAMDEAGETVLHMQFERAVTISASEL